MYFRLAVGGSLGNTEVWSINPAFDPEGEVTTNEWNAAAGQAMVQAAGNTPPPALLLTLLSTAAKVSNFRLEGRHDTTHALLGVAEYVRGNGWAGTGTPTKPAQTSVVLSLRTPLAGATGRGRLYWPALGASIDQTSLRMSGTDAAAIAGAGRLYLQSLQDEMKNAAGGLDLWTSLNLAVISRTSGSRNLVNRIQVGDVLDVQRRRRDRLRESYSTVDFPD